jgi:hypothetical protein
LSTRGSLTPPHKQTRVNQRVAWSLFVFLAVGCDRELRIGNSTTMVSAVIQPSIIITNPTPPRPCPTLGPTQTHHRLLYRGSLSLPDSHLLLDGLTFTGHAENSTSLLENPLALALESMRGRPTLRLLGTMKLSEGWIDYSGGVCL